MALILSIETATPVCSVALYNDNILLGNQSLFIAQSHSGLLVPSIKSLVTYCGHTMQELDAVAVSMGPGSYTGLRIGVSTAKGLCDALSIPLIAVNTLIAMAKGVSKYVRPETILCPMIDARRMEVYCLMADNNLNVLEETTPKVIDESSFREELEKYEVCFFGNGASKCKDVIVDKNAFFVDGVEPDAIHIGSLAFIKYQNQDFEDVAYFNPFYLKEFRISKPKVK